MSRDIAKQKIAQNAHYIKNKQKYYERSIHRRNARKEWLSEIRHLMVCRNCSESAPEVIDFHHIEPSDKEFEIRKILNAFRSMSKVIKEIQKCVPLCSNCHRKYHAGTLDIKFTIDDTIKIPEHLIVDSI